MSTHTHHQINESHLGDEATRAQAEQMVELLTAAGYPSEYNPMQGVSSDLTNQEDEDSGRIPEAVWMECASHLTFNKTAEIVKVSAIHGESPGSVDVSIRNHSMVRVALEWEHIDIATNSLTDAATARIESEVKRKGGFDEVEWNTKA